MNLQRELDRAKHAVAAGSRCIIQLYESGAAQERKADNTWVTEADHKANAAICLELHAAFPNDGILTEEAIREQDIPDRGTYLSLLCATQEWCSRERSWYVDPLDGTRDFVERTGDFGPIVGLALRGENPILGVAGFPLKGEMYWAVKGGGAWKAVDKRVYGIAVETGKRLKMLRLVASLKSQEPIQRFMVDNNMREVTFMGSSGLKVCRVAEGAADLYIGRRPVQSLWDFCGPQVILEEAGGCIHYLDGTPINYWPEEGQSTKVEQGTFTCSKANYQQLQEIFARTQF